MKSLNYIVLVSLLCLSCSAFAQTTTIWLVRHAEKEAVAITDTAKMSASDPNLSAEGKLRAEALALELKDSKISAVFTTTFKRTHQTAVPTLKRFQLIATTYNPANLPAFAKHVLTFYAGSNVLIVGHSNTIIPTLQAFGATKPFDALVDDDYDLLFKITIGPYRLTNTVVKYYGSKHHSTQIKE